MTLALLELALGGAFLYAGLKCVKLIPLLAGNEVAGDNCTGSLLAIAAAYITGKVGGSVIQKILTAGAGAAVGAAAKKAGGKILGRGGGAGEPVPTEPVPTPEIPPVVDVVPLSFTTPPAVAAAGVNVATAVPLQAKGLHSFTVTV